MGDWRLGIDFGTSFTVAATADGGQVRVIDIESNGRSRIPSTVLLSEDGDILVGTNAQHQATFSPERFEPTPKRCIADGEIFLGDRFIGVDELVAAVLRTVYREASRQHGNTLPRATRITHPAEWAETRLNVLRSAVARAELPNAELISEPVAAAAWIASATTHLGELIAVYDFGGGTFDAAVLRRTDTGFEVAGPPSGRDPLGGEDLDRAVVQYLATLLAEDHPDEWSKLMNPPDAPWRRNSAALREEVQRAKEMLSDVLVCQLWVPGIEREIQLTRHELDEHISSYVDATVESLIEAIEAAHVTSTDLVGIYLVGGSSRIPLVADAIWRKLQVRPAVQDNPKSVVAMGAANWDTAPRPAAGGPSLTPASPVRSESGALPVFRSQLVLLKGAGSEERGSTFTALFLAEDSRSRSGVIRISDEPARGRNVAGLSQEVLETRARRMAGFKELWVGPCSLFGDQGGLERRFSALMGGGEVAMFERYMILGDRAVVLVAPEPARAVADTLHLAPPVLAPDKYFEPRLTMPVPDGWTLSERVVLVQGRSGYEVTADHMVTTAPVGLEQWRDRQVAALMRQLSGAQVISAVPARVLNRLDGGQVQIRSGEGRDALITTLWLALDGDRDGYYVTIHLREREQALFGALSSVAILNPSASPIHPLAATAPSAGG